MSCGNYDWGIHQGNTLDINFTVTDADGNAVNLTDATIQFTVSSTLNAEPKFTKTCTIDVAASGTCHATLTAEDTDTAGVYTSELVIKWAGESLVITSEKMSGNIERTMTDLS